jgi:hypothetical protein
MSALMDFESLVLSLNPVLYCPFIKGHINKEDSYGGALSVASGSPGFTDGPNGYLLNTRGGRLSIADSGARPELRIDPGTIAAFSFGFRFATTAENNYRLVSKLDVGGNHFDWFVTSTAQTLSFAGSAPFWSDNPDNVKSMVVTFEDGSTPHLWFDGVDKGVGSSPASITANDADLSIGAFYTGIRPCPVPLTFVLMFPTQLTAQNISDLHYVYEWVHIETVEPQLTMARPLQVANPLLYLDGYVTGGKAIDASGNSFHLDKQNGVEMEPGVPVGDAGFEAHGGARNGAYLDITDTGLDNHVAKTFMFWVRFDGWGEANAGRLFEKGVLKLLIYANGAGTLIFQEAWSGGNAVWNSWTNLVLGKWYHIAIRHDGLVGSVPVLTINGVSNPFTVGSASSGTRDNDAGVFTMLDQRNYLRELDGVIADFQWYARYLTDVEVETDHLRGALRVLDRGYSHVYADSLGAKTAGNVGPFSIISGTHKWEDNILSCSATSQAHTQNGDAFGAQHFKLYKGGDANTAEFAFIASDSSAILSTNQFGYSVLIASDESVILRRLDGSSATNLITTAASYAALNTWYEFLPVRSPTGVFKLWIRGGAYSTWTLVGTSAADTIYTKSNYSIVSLGSGDKFSSYMRFPNGGGLEPNDIPLLAD